MAYELAPEVKLSYNSLTLVYICNVRAGGVKRRTLVSYWFNHYEPFLPLFSGILYADHSSRYHRQCAKTARTKTEVIVMEPESSFMMRAP
jgi:hypothetical protein